MGLLKHYHTLLHSGRTRSKKVLREAREAEAWVMEQVRMSFVTEAEFNAWLLRGARRRWEACTACPLSTGQPCYGGWVQKDPLLFVMDEAPDEDEERSGLPHEGRPGSLFRGTCAKIGLDLSTWAWSTHTVLCRPPWGRAPDKAERGSCLPRLEEQLDLLRPRVILLLGGSAGKWVGRDYVDVEEYRGLVPKADWPHLPYATKANLVAIFLTHSPSWVLHQSNKRAALGELAEDLRKVQRLCSLLDRKRREAKLPTPGGDE